MQELDLVSAEGAWASKICTLAQVCQRLLCVSACRPAYIGIVCTDLDVHDAINFAVQKTKQVCNSSY